MTSTSMSMSTAGSKPFNFKLTGTIVLLLVFLAAAVAVLTAEITASGGRGKAQTYGAVFNLTLSATQEADQCNYKGFWSYGTQEGSGFLQPCTESGYQNYLKHLFDTGKIKEPMYNALRAIIFW